jgi:hypothetical protein
VITDDEFLATPVLWVQLHALHLLLDAQINTVVDGEEAIYVYLERKVLSGFMTNQFGYFSLSYLSVIATRRYEFAFRVHRYHVDGHHVLWELLLANCIAFVVENVELAPLRADEQNF